MTDPLRALVREPECEPAGALALLHGRGADEHDLAPLLDALDPQRRVLGILPRGPLSLPPGGAHWYRLGGIPTPDRETFDAAFSLASSFLDDLPVPLDRTVLGGFSQGAVMSLALGLGSGRPRPAGIVALSGFLPRVDGFSLDLEHLDGYPAFIAHGSLDPVISVEFGRDVAVTLREAGGGVRWRESPVPHTVDPRILPELQAFVEDSLRLASQNDDASR